MDTTLPGRLVVLVLGVTLALAVAVAVVLPRDASAAPPEPVDDTFVIEGVCDFPVLANFTGKVKFIDLPGARAITTSPGLRVTLTNLEEPANQVTYVITGAFHDTVLANGNLAVVATGRNLLFDPSFGMFLTIGRFTFLADAEGTPLTRPTGTGRMIDVCAQLV